MFPPENENIGISSYFEFKAEINKPEKLCNLENLTNW